VILHIKRESFRSKNTLPVRSMRTLEYTLVGGMMGIAIAVGLMSTHAFDAVLKVTVIIAACLCVAVLIRTPKRVKSKYK
jgi:branched-subunit amino acid transport protein